MQAGESDLDISGFDLVQQIPICLDMWEIELPELRERQAGSIPMS
ncbi:hypothetical protein PLUA15_270005 [Pseudomonas lundensis]|uniref:Uncharacterized protein n=1 Tax=Pseudomonas lundensis TaxID=86185 RepID=A0AAX2H8I8_9PSED|nr:hypothetical protein PLUA15_270005 [Pseudomonas lundensis]